MPPFTISSIAIFADDTSILAHGKGKIQAKEKLQEAQNNCLDKMMDTMISLIRE